MKEDDIGTSTLAVPATTTLGDGERTGGRISGVRVPRTMTGCVHKRGGLCELHGPGAKKRVRPIRVVVKGPDGKDVVKIKQKTFYTCDVGEGGTRLLQTRLSFGGRVTRTIERDQKGYLGNDDIEDDSVGQ